jgi:hypothetical protein
MPFKGHDLKIDKKRNRKHLSLPQDLNQNPPGVDFLYLDVVELHRTQGFD